MMEKYKLNFELVPDSCWAYNLRSILRPKDWDTVRRDAYARANGRCMICNRPVKRLEAHERWQYDEKKAVQKLVDVIAICHMCHSVIHIGRTALCEDFDRAAAWFMKINGCTYSDFNHALSEANAEHIRRNGVPEWSLNVDYLKKYD